MYLTQTNVIRGLTKEQFNALTEMCRYSNNLYNYALYCVRQYWFENKKCLPYEEKYHVCKENENYKLIQAGLSCQVLKIVDRSFKSFFNLLKKARQNEYRFQDVKMPRYHKKGDLFLLVCPIQHGKNIRNGKFLVPMSLEFRRTHPGLTIEVPFPSRLDPESVKEIRILPCQHGRFFKIQYVYKVEQEPLGLNKDNALGIDLGVNNLATCVPTNGTPFILDGRRIKSINHCWNKERARLQSVADKQGIRGGRTNRVYHITERRNNQVKDVIRKSARYVVEYCKQHDIGTIVVGYSPEFKQSPKLGKSNNQNFTQIPLGDFRLTLKSLCERYDIDYVEQEESYTSKSSFLDNDPLPDYRSEQPYKGTFSGKRVKRGLYKSSNGTLINADVNAAANILRKASRIDSSKLCQGLLASPQRIRVS